MSDERKQEKERDISLMALSLLNELFPGLHLLAANGADGTLRQLFRRSVRIAGRREEK